MPKSEREETLAALSSRIFSSLLEDLILDVSLQSHHEIARSRAICRVCNTRCGLVHTPGSLATAVSSQSSATRPPSSRADTPSSIGDTNVTGGTSTPTMKEGNLYLECLSCQRAIASNRYAPHISTCMGLSSARRGPVRGNAKAKPASDAGRSASPESDAVNVSDQQSPAKGKGKPKKRSDEGDFTLKRKRPGSPQTSPNKKPKTGKAKGSPVSRVKAEPTSVMAMPSNSHYSPSTSSQSKIPSKLRDSSTASFLDRSSSSSSSRSLSPGGRSVGTAASSFSVQSPNLSARAIGKSKGTRGRPTIPPLKRASPPRPPPIHVPDYTVDVDAGEETGSSTDTDSN